ncbi:hypothetical protein AMTRI_Chr04g245380 [Amborella trichopoda]
MRQKRGKPKILSWEKMKSRLKEKFLPIDYTQMFFSQFNNLRQETKSAAEYTKEFYKLIARNDIQETEEQLVSRYVVEMHQLWKINDDYQLALKVEVKLSCGSARKYVEVRSFYPSSKGETSNGGNTNKDLPKNSTIG